MIGCETKNKMEDHIDLHEDLYKMINMVDLIYEDYEEKMAIEEREKKREDDNAPLI